ncbi:hypothetical protein RDI58_007308 [Solanum bulbocastanum]|uniref:Uncharacterized protein n=1 Tax=Solanum bulbocastanum TaxID=147425 RepID=A0AAN8YIH6_SOLBU
MTLLLGLYHL